MSFFKNLKNNLSLLPKKLTVLSTLMLAVAIPATVWGAWGPDRPTFDYNKFDPAVSCTDPSTAGGRCGSMTGPVFNSFINTPSYGDERNFVTASPAGQAVWRDSVGGVTAGQEVEVRVFFHNNANQATNDPNFTGPGVARNTRIRVFVPTGQSNGFDVAGYVSADNATPSRVFDTAAITGNQTFSLSYVPGSARLYNNGPFAAGVALPDDVVGPNGTQVGQTALNGNVPGCFDFEGVVTIKLRINAPALQLTKQVTTPGSTNWQSNMNVNRGDTISWLINYKDTGTDNINGLTLRDTIPAGLTLVPGSITWFDANHPTGLVLKDDALNGNGVVVGNYAPNGGGYIRFRTTVNQSTPSCTLTNVAYGRAEGVPEQSAQAAVQINNCVPVTPPTVTTTVQRLPDTGPGDTLAFVSISTIAGAFLHRLRTLRRLR